LSTCIGGHSKVPRKEHDFLVDQRATRQMHISTIDKIETHKNHARIERRERFERRIQDYHNSQIQQELESADEVALVFDDNYSLENGRESDEDKVAPEHTFKVHLDLPLFYLDCDRAQV